MAAPDSMQARQAALLLHGLPAAARRQVIARLDLAERLRLSPLLAELSELGVSQSLGHQLQLALPAQPPEATVNARALTAQEQVERLTADDVLRCLLPCAAATVAHLLRASAWPWKADVLATLPQPLRGDVIECLRSDSTQLAPAVLTFFCERLCHQAALVQAASAQRLNHRPPARAGMKSRLGSLTTWMR
ncbi:MAG: hypothetical protein ABI605_03595 [Rhizobacter sp.]